MPQHAFVDESFSGDYLVAAVLVPAGNVNAARASLRGVLRSGQRRIHFKDERLPRKDRVLSVIDRLEVTAGVYVTANERKARGVCLERMVPDLAAARVSRLVLERDESLARFDRQVLARLTRVHCPDLSTSTSALIATCCCACPTRSRGAGRRAGDGANGWPGAPPRYGCRKRETPLTSRPAGCGAHFPRATALALIG